MPGKKLLSIAAASVMGLSLAAGEARAGNWHSSWTGFGVGLLAAPIIFSITRPLLGGIYDAFYTPFGLEVGARRGHYRNGSEWCARRYRSYDPASHTFLGRDGRRHICRG